MTTLSPAPLDHLRRDQPEWRPWLAVVEDVLRASCAAAWDEAAEEIRLKADPTTPTAHNGTPLLAGAALSIPPRAVSELLRRLIRTAREHGTTRMVTLEAVLHADIDPLRLFTASLSGDDRYAKEVARESGADPEVFHEVAALVPVPFLQACNRRRGDAISAGWIEPYCPICGSWPAFVEVRGIERSRCFRCGRCGSEWHARMLRCPFCGLDDHRRLVSLAPQDGGRLAIEACGGCLGYVKTFTALDGCPPLAVMIEDLASVDLDLAALDLGYARPKGPGYELRTSITAI